MNKEHHNENKNDEEDTLTLAKLFSNWYVGAVVGFGVGGLKGSYYELTLFMDLWNNEILSYSLSSRKGDRMTYIHRLA